MLSCAVASLMVAVVAAILGFSGIVGSASDIALILAVVALVVAIDFRFARRSIRTVPRPPHPG